MSNLFSSPWFLETAAEVLFPGEGCRPATAEVEGQLFDLLLFPDGEPAFSPLMDFVEARAPSPRPAAVVVIPWLPATSHGRVALGPAGEPGDRGGLLPAPLVDWTDFASWDDFVRHAGARDGRAFGKTDRKLRKLGRELGPARFSLDDPDHVLVERMLLWKSQQLRAGGRLDRFASPRNRQFIHRLVQRRELTLSALFAGDRPLAMLLGHADREGYACWITAYDPVFAALSPGVLLFEHLMRWSWDQGHREFDFLIGDEAYKYHYATHERRVGPLGRPPVAARVRERLRRVLEPDDGAPLATARARTRTLVIDLLERRLHQQALTPLPVSAGKPEIELSRATWPRPRMEAAEDCQMLRMLDQADARMSRWDLLRVRAEHTRNRIRSASTRWWNAFGAAPLPEPPAAVSPTRAPHLKEGEWVRVRPHAEIAATLKGGSLNGIYFIPGLMERFEGRRFRVQRPVGRFFDEKRRQVVRTRDAVLLEGVRCDGSQIYDSRGCDRGCLLFWNEAWLERIDTPPEAAAADHDGPRMRVRSLAEIERLVAEHPDGLPFIAATMAPFAGRTFPVHRRLRHAYDERQGRVFEVDDAVVLEGAYCAGVPLSSGGQCDRCCPLYWRAEWLEELPAPTANPNMPAR